MLSRFARARKFSVFFLLLVFSFSLVASVGAKKPSAESKKISGRLAGKLSKAKTGQKFSVVVKLLKPSGQTVRTRISLQADAGRAQKALLAELAKERRRGAVKDYRSFWIANAVVVKADAKTIRDLAARPDVAQIIENFRVRAIDPVPERALAGSPGPAPANGGNEWNLNKIKAPDVWSGFSVDGTGTTVAVLDTGIDPTHQDLAGKIGTFVEVDEYGNATATAPKDTDQHGTHVSGIIAGGDKGGTAIGVAPGATLMGAVVIPYGYGTFAQVLGGLEWAADPDGDPGTTDQPDAVNLSLGGQGLMAQMIEPIDNLVALGIFPAIAAGNWSGYTTSPADVPSAFAVGAVDNLDRVAWWSGGSEVTWYEEAYEGTYIKPDASAPGVSIKSSIPGNTYVSWSGTSMATPHLAGSAALLRNLDASLTADDISSILQGTAVDLGDEGKDTRYGSGRVDLLAAAGLASTFGTIEGTVTVGGESTAATVKVLTEPTGTVATQAFVGPTGRYRALVSPGDYRVRISKYGYDTTLSVPLTIADDGKESFSPDLKVAARFSLRGAVKNSSGTSLKTTVSLLSPTKKSATFSAGTYSFNVPAGEYRLKAESFGYKPKEATVTVSGNTTRDFTLGRVSKRLLVVDWLAGPYKNYYTDALDAAGVDYDVLDISWTGGATLQAEALYLSQYRQVVWAAGDGPASGALYSFDSNTLEVNEPPLASFLDNGGRLFLSGQDVAFYLVGYSLSGLVGPTDEVPSYDEGFLGRYLRARLLKDKSNNSTISGRSGTLFAGRTMSILGGDGADNQWWPDVLQPINDAVGELVYTKETTGAASLRTLSGDDNRGKLVYFGFGLEGLNNAADRTYATSKALGWLSSPAGTLTLTPSTLSTFGLEPVALFGKLTPGGSGKTVRIERRTTTMPYWDYRAENGVDPGGSSQVSWQEVTSVKTGADGGWSAMVMPEANSVYRAVWDGSLQYSQTFSKPAQIKVRPRFNLRALHRSAPAGTTNYIIGSVTPAPIGDDFIYSEGPGGFGTSLRLLEKRVGATDFRFYKEAQIGFDGTVRIPVKPQAHTYYRLELPASNKYKYSLSSPVYLRAKHRLTLKAESTLVPRNIRFSFSGQVLPEHAFGLLRLQRRVPGGPWRTVRKITLKGAGRWRADYRSSEEGRFQFRSLLEADRAHDLGVSNQITVRFY